ncbi:putative membrane protein [Desulfosporosinus sp. OT]|nr:putative membrane protein [Desulfosporosinus sp. OT]
MRNPCRGLSDWVIFGRIYHVEHFLILVGGVVRLIKIPLIALILQGIPEQVAVTTLAFVIAGIHLKWDRILMIGIGQAFCAYVVRLFPIPFGIHTILLLIMLFIILTKFTKGDVALSFMASSITFLVLGIFELTCMSLVMQIFGFTPETLFNDLVLRILVGELNMLLLFISAFLVNKLYITSGIHL